MIHVYNDGKGKAQSVRVDSDEEHLSEVAPGYGENFNAAVSEYFKNVIAHKNAVDNAFTSLIYSLPEGRVCTVDHARNVIKQGVDK